MAEGYVALPPDSTGKKARTQELTVGANTVEQPVETLADPAGNLIGAFVGGALPAFNPDLETRFYRLLNQMVPDGWELRSSLAETSYTDGATTYTGVDGSSLYLGMAPDGTGVQTAGWQVLRIYQDSAGNPSRWRTVTSVAWLTTATGSTVVTGGAIFGANPPWT